MDLRVGLLRLVRSLSSDRSERRRLGAAAVEMLRLRRFKAMALGPLLRVVPTHHNAKLHLWYGLSRSLGDGPVCSNLLLLLLLLLPLLLLLLLLLLLAPHRHWPVSDITKSSLSNSL